MTTLSWPVQRRTAEPAGQVLPATCRMSLSSLVAKRAMDLVGASLILVVVAPLLALIALLILVDSGRPVVFTQPRVGARPRRLAREITWELRSFRMLKFRTMRRDVSPQLHEEFVRAFVAGGGLAAPGKLVADPRVTRVGRWLRATSLDELPQLFNVLSGRMSLVGPRPVPEYEVAAYEAEHLCRIAGLPGMTGLWQVSGRGRTTFEQMVGMDVEYLTHRSLAGDLWLLARTIPSVVAGRGAR